LGINASFWSFYKTLSLCGKYICRMKKPLLQLHAAVFLWGFTGVLGREITLNEGLLVWWRMLITVVTLVVLRVIQTQFERITWRDALEITGIGALVALHWVCFYGSIKYSNVSIALTCLSTLGFFTSLLEPIILRKRIESVEVLFGVLSIVGIALIFHFNPNFKVGIVIGIISALLSCLFSIFNKRLVGRITAKTLALYEFGGGFLVWSLILPFYNYLFPSPRFFPTTADWVWLLVLSWACTILAVNLSFNALKHISAFTQNLTLNLEPVYGIILAFAIYHENKNLSAGFYWGFAIIVLVVVLQMWRVRKQNRIEASAPIDEHLL
jgi:drug/metabolite transporter (DMT)-like permease